jgi:Fic family protein
MLWNWQQPDWPRFDWDPQRLVPAERQFLLSSGVILGSGAHLGSEERLQLTIDLMSSEALTTSQIEGETLDRPSVQSSIRRQLGLATDPRQVKPGEQGIAEMMVDVYRTFAAPLTPEALLGWHRMVTNGRRDLTDIGRYRTGQEPMQIVSGRLDAPTVHFEAPPSARVPSEMEGFLRWFHQTAPQGKTPLPALTRAGIAHLHFESIHPFEDGNGRIGRAIAEKALAQGSGQPSLIALSPTLLAHRRRYYEALAQASRSGDVTDWLAWFAEMALAAQRRTLAQIALVIDKAKLFERLQGTLNHRQEKALLRMFREGPDGFRGGLSAGNYISITGASPATATRDLADLTEKGALIKVGERKHTRYYLMRIEDRASGTP